MPQFEKKPWEEDWSKPWEHDWGKPQLSAADQAAKAAQAKKFPSSQEQGKGGAGVDDTAGGRFITNFGLDATLPSPSEFVAGLPMMLKSLVDPKNSALQAAAARQRGETTPDPYGLLAITDAAAKKDLPTVAGKVAGQTVQAAQMAALGEQGVKLAPAVGRKVVAALPEAGALRRAAGAAARYGAGESAQPLTQSQRADMPRTLNLARQGARVAKRGAAAGTAKVLRTAAELKEASKPPVMPQGPGKGVPTYDAYESTQNQLREVHAAGNPVARPQTPQFIEQQLEAMRQAETPEQLYAREQARRGQVFEPDVKDTVRGQLEQVVAERDPTTYKPAPDTGLPTVEPPPPLTAPELNKWMNVSSKDVGHGTDPGARALSEKLIGADKAATKANFDTALKASGQALESRLKQSTEIIDANDIVIDSLAEAKGRYAPKDATIQKNIDTIWEQIADDYPNLDKLSPLETQRLKSKLGDSIAWKGEAAQAPFNQALIRIYRALNGKIKAAVPGAAEELSRWGDLYIGSKSLAESLNKDVVGRGSGSVPPVANRAEAMKALGR